MNGIQSIARRQSKTADPDGFTLRVAKRLGGQKRPLHRFYKFVETCVRQNSDDPYRDYKYVCGPFWDRFSAQNSEYPISCTRRDYTVAVSVEMLLQWLAENDLVGRIEWTGVTDCTLSYHRFASRIDRVVTRRLFRAAEERIVATVTRRTTTVNLCNAVTKERLRDQPIKARIVFEAIPEWLRPEVRFVVGDIESGRTEESIHWQESRLLLPATPPQPVAPKVDPAIVIGDYVFIGW